MRTSATTQSWLLGGASLVLLAGIGAFAPLPTNRSLEAAFDLIHAPVSLVLTVVLLFLLDQVPLLWRRLGVLALAVVLGAGIELVQSRLGREASLRDLLADVLGALGGLAWAARGRSPARRAFFAIVAVAALAIASYGPMQTLADVYRQRREMPRLASFERDAELRRWSHRESTMERSAAHATDGVWALRLDLDRGEYPGTALAYPFPDWSGHDELRFDVYLEPGPAVELTVKVEDAWFRHEDDDRFQTTFRVKPGPQRLRISLADVARGPRRRRLDLTHVARLAFFSYRLDTPRTLFLDDVVLVDSANSTWSAPPAPGAGLCEGLLQDKGPHPMTALAKPALGQAVTDPQFGTTIRRITAVPIAGSPPVIKPMYSTISAWNADESRLILFSVERGHQLYDGRTYVFMRDLNINPVGTEQVYWHTSDPDLLFYVDNKTWIRYHVSTDVKEQVRTFTFCSSPVSGSSDPMFMSWDSKRIGLECGNQSFIYDISANTVTGLKTSNRGAPQVAPSGTLALWDGDVADAQLNVLRTLDLANPFEHASLGRYSNGRDTYNASVYEEGPQGSGVGALVTHDMTDGTWKVIVGPATGYSYAPGSIHISALAYQQPGWVAVSVVDNVSGQNVLDNELLLADTNTGKVCRIGHHRSYGKNNTKLATPYWAEPHAVPSPSGTRVVFGSDWGNGPSVDTYVVELPSYNPNVASLSNTDVRIRGERGH